MEAAAGMSDEDDFRRLMHLMYHHRGAANAITLEEITTRAGISNRRMTERIIKEHLANFPYPLVANGAGYFIPTDAEQINTYLNSLDGRALECFLRKRTVIRKALADGWKRDGKRFARPPQQLDFFEEQARKEG